MTNFPFIFGTPWPWWSVVLAGAGAGYLTWRGYRRHKLEIKWPRLKLLNALRLASWTLLFLCLLQPMYREYVRENKASRLTVLADDSESMSFADRRNGPSRMARVKAALVGEQALAEASKPDAEVKAEKNALLEILPRSFQVQLESFSSATRVLANGASANLAKAAVSELRAEGDGTDIAKALNDSFTRLRGPDAGGLVLISDGQDTAHGELERVCGLFKRAGIPIYALGVGEPNLRDLAIAQVRCRRTVSKDTLVRVEVEARRTGFGDEVSRHNVFIKRNGQVVGKPVTLEMKGETGTAVFEFLPEAQGFLEYEAYVEPFPGELITANNSMAFGLMAFSRKLKVLYVEGSMFIHIIYDSKTLPFSSHPMQHWWEHQFLENALREDLDIEEDFLAWWPGASREPSGEQKLNVLPFKEGYPKTKKDLYQYDVIICSGVPYTDFTDEQVRWTVDFVAKHRGGFVMTGGYHSFGEGHYAKTPMDRMLPVEMAEGDDEVDNSNSDGSPVNFHWQLTDEAWQHPIMQIEKDEEKNREAWSRQPVFHGFSRTTHAKGAATVLANVGDEQYDTAYGPALLLAVQEYGNGRSMAMTTDTTGSWGTEWEDSWGPPGATSLTDRNLYYKTFWKNAVRWLAHYRMQAPNQLVQLETDRLVYGRGETPELRVRVMNEDYELTHDASVVVNVTAPGGKTQPVTVFPRYDEPGVYERKLELSAVGRYEIEAVAKLKKEELGRDKAFLHITPATVELRQLSQNVELLKRLAAETGGVYLPLENAAELPRHLRDATHVIERHRDNDLWDRPWIFALIIGLLCCEWFLRKRNGLP